MAVTEETTGRYVLPEGVGYRRAVKPAGIACPSRYPGIGIPILIPAGLTTRPGGRYGTLIDTISDKFPFVELLRRYLMKCYTTNWY
jgi:hypothetical protein